MSISLSGLTDDFRSWRELELVQPFGDGKRKRGRACRLKRKRDLLPTPGYGLPPRRFCGVVTIGRWTYKPSGKAAYCSTLRIHLIPALGDKPLSAITTKDVQRLKSMLHKKAPKTVNNVLTVFNVLLKTAVAGTSSSVSRAPSGYCGSRNRWRVSTISMTASG